MANPENPGIEYEPKKEITEEEVFEMIKDREVFIFLNNILLDLERINPGGDKIHAFDTRRGNIRWFLRALERDLGEGKIDRNITFDKLQENYPKKIFFEFAWLLNNTDLKI